MPAIGCCCCCSKPADTQALHLCRVDSEATSTQLAQVTESKEGLETKLEQLTNAQSMLTQQHEGLAAEMTQVQGALQAAEEGRASAEVIDTAYAKMEATCS